MSGDFAQPLRTSLAGICQLTEAQIEQLHRHYELLVRWNKVLNLTSIRRMAEAVVRHYGESLFLAAHLPPGRLTVADIGSGAGFPGIPAAVYRPDCRITLVESHQRKAVFLREATRDYPNVTVLARRAEEVRDTFDWVVARAVRPAEVVRLVPRLGPRVSLLVGEHDSCKLLILKEITWENPISLPWGQRRILLLGERRPG